MGGVRWYGAAALFMAGGLLTYVLNSHYTQKPLQLSSSYTIDKKGFDSTLHYFRYLESRLSQDPTIRRQQIETRISVFENSNSLLPFRNLSQKKFLLLTYRYSFPSFLNGLTKYAPIEHMHLDTYQDKKVSYAGSFDPVILAIGPQEYDTTLVRLLRNLEKKTRVVVVNFSDPGAFTWLGSPQTGVQAYTPDSLTQHICAQMVFGGTASSGRLPVYSHRYGLQLKKHPYPASRLTFEDPGAACISQDSILKLDQIVLEGIKEKAFPGAQVLVVWKGKVIVQRAYGYHAYDQKIRLTNDHLFDIASITKVAATSPAAMKLYEEGKLQLNARVGDYIKIQPELYKKWKPIDTLSYRNYIAQLAGNALAGIRPNPDYDTLRYKDSLIIIRQSLSPLLPPAFESVRIHDLLTHTSGLQPVFPIRSDLILQYNPYDPAIRIKPAQFRDTLWSKALTLSLRPDRYRYSDINMILLQQVIDSINKQPIDSYLSEKFYRPLGLKYIGYNPLDKTGKNSIPPTEFFPLTQQLIHGKVHDPTAALMGGVAGHAGLFSNALDLAILFQMLLQKGYYGGERFLSRETVEIFTRSAAASRALGFDKPVSGRENIIAPSASPNTFGHTGFTGGCVWADPDGELIFIFLSNRVHPSGENWKINKLKIRERLHQLIYNSLPQ